MKCQWLNVTCQNQFPKIMDFIYPTQIEVHGPRPEQTVVLGYKSTSYIYLFMLEHLEVCAPLLVLYTLDISMWLNGCLIFCDR